MPKITTEDYRYFENKVLLPMLITVLEGDLETIHKLPFKLRKPYVGKIESTLTRLRYDLKITDVYLTQRHMRVIRNKLSAVDTEYVYIASGHEERRKYTSVQLRDKCEELLGKYFAT